MGNFPFPANPALALQATTGAAGFALQNGTPTILTWTPPADGNMHRAMVFYTLHVTSAETGGAVATSFTSPDNAVGQSTALAGGSGTGVFIPNGPQFMTVRGGTAVTVTQTSALTAGAAVVFAEIWGA